MIIGGTGLANRPGKPVRFRVVDADGRHSASWKVDTSVGRGDVYIAHREGGHLVHASLHHDGRRHFAFPNSYEEVTREPHYAGPGWQHLARISIGATELRPWPEAVSGRGVIDVAMPPGCDALAVDVLLSDPGAPPLSLPDSQHVATLQRGDGGLSVILARPLPVAQPVPVLFAEDIAVVRADHRTAGRTKGDRAVLVLPSAGGPLHQVEVAIDPD